MTVSTPSLPRAMGLARELVTPALQKTVAQLCPDMSRVAGYHHGWLDADGRPTTSGGGKAIRPALVLLSAHAVGGSSEAAVPAAVAVELVHSFSLLHDDIMDGDTERRHRPTAWTVFGTSSAILAGDALLTAAVEILLDQPVEGARAAARCLSAATQRLITGQTADLDFERRDDVQLSECLAMAGDKTSALLNCASSLGAILAGGPPQVVSGLGRFGEHLGAAFQLVDDLLGIWGSPEVTGKPVLSDLRSRKKSLPVVSALRSGGIAAYQLTALYFRSDPLSEDELALAAELVEEAGGRQWAQQEAAAQLSAAADCLGKLDLSTEIRDGFLEVAQFVTDRDF
jgi:geranylgeranyl diphosphate synthase, type I